MINVIAKAVGDFLKQEGWADKCLVAERIDDGNGPIIAVRKSARELTPLALEGNITYLRLTGEMEWSGQSQPLVACSTHGLEVPMRLVVVAFSIPSKFSCANIPTVAMDLMIGVVDHIKKQRAAWSVNQIEIKSMRSNTDPFDVLVAELGDKAIGPRKDVVFSIDFTLSVYASAGCLRTLCA